MDQYKRGYREGFADGLASALDAGVSETRVVQAKAFVQKKRKRRQSGKQKLLTQMTKKKWDKYKKTSGKKTYVQIRAMVSRSQEYKRKAKKL
jgi:hypothetical protein